MNEKELAELRKRRRPEIELLRCAAQAVVSSNVLGPSEKVAGFLAMVGHNYSSELMVVGRATNGWGGSNLSTSKLEDFVDEAIENADPHFGAENQRCPMSWIIDQWGAERAQNASDKYNTKKSAFWRVIKRMTEALDIAQDDPSKDDSWPSHLVWSNLYKIAPAVGGNPPNRLQYPQREACAALLKMELETYRPKRVIFLTGLDWAEELWNKIPGANTFVKHDWFLVEAVGTYNLSAQRELPSQCIRIVVAKHPDRKKRDDWVRCVLDAFNVTG